MAAGVHRLDSSIGINATGIKTERRIQVPGSRRWVGIGERVSAEVADVRHAGATPGDNAGVVRGGLSAAIRKRGDGLRVGKFLCKHIRQWTKFADGQFVVAHCFDFRRVVGGDVELHLATERFARRIRKRLVRWREDGRVFVSCRLRDGFSRNCPVTVRESWWCQLSR